MTLCNYEWRILFIGVRGHSWLRLCPPPLSEGLAHQVLENGFSRGDIEFAITNWKLHLVCGTLLSSPRVGLEPFWGHCHSIMDLYKYTFLFVWCLALSLSLLLVMPSSRPPIPYPVYDFGHVYDTLKTPIALISATERDWHSSLKKTKQIEEERDRET